MARALTADQQRSNRRQWIASRERSLSQHPKINLATLLLEQHITSKLQDGQRCALLSVFIDVLTHKVHSPDSCLQRSVLIKAVNDGQFQVAGAELLKWCYVDSEIDRDAYERRQDDVQLFFCTS